MDGILSKYITPGCRVDLQAIERIRLNQEKGTKNAKTYQSKVLDILSEDRVEIAMPMEQSKLILLPVGGEFNLYFYGTSGLYQCYARVMNRYKNNAMYVLTMDLISNLRRYQRREYYRFSCALKMNSRQLQEEELKEKDKETDVTISELPLKSSIIVDISGGGLRFVADYAYEVNSLILCNYRLQIGGESREYNLVGKVLSVRELENRDGAYEHRVQYIDMDTAKREEIIKYIFDEERRTLKNQKRENLE